MESIVDTDGDNDHRFLGDIGESLAATAFALARRFAHGATLWCVAPQHPEHARHVAVEFVHPVLVGKRALPAVSVDAVNPVPPLRSLVRAGDVVLVIAEGDDATAFDVTRRAPAWGATTIWMGSGRRPPQGAADHLVWIESDHEALNGAGNERTSAAYDGRLVLLYHVLWELTHVCFEHPGLLGEGDGEEAATACAIDTVGAPCITCSDEGRLGEVIHTDGDSRSQVRTARGIETIDTTIVSPVRPGDLVLIHAGAAIAELT